LPRPAPADTTAVGPGGVLFFDGVPTFPLILNKPPPLGSRTPWGTNGLDEVALAGVNLFGAGPIGAPWTDAMLEETRAWTHAADARGVHTWVGLRELARAQPGTPEDETLRKVVTALKDEPGFGMWKGADEPWHSGLSVEVLRHAAAWRRALDPNHLSVVIQAPRGTVVDLAPYVEITDVHGVDPYPVKFKIFNPNLHHVGRWTALIGSVTPNRAVMTTIGACFSGSRDQTGTGAVRLPTRHEQRYMVYDAILNGARGLVFFGNHNPWCFGPGDGQHGWNWTHWSDVLAPIVREIGPRSALYRALLVPAGRRLRVSDPTTQVATRRVGRDLWVLAARRGAWTRSVRISGLPRGAVRGSVYRENRTVRVRRGVFTDRFTRWGVHVYRFRLPGR
jgi:hypothetical protein